MIVIFNESFDKNEYPNTPVSKLESGERVSVAGSLTISKKTCSSGPMFSCTLSRRDGKIGISVFPENDLFSFVESMPTSCEAIVYGTVAVNGKYVNVVPDNIEYFTETSLPASEFQVSTSALYQNLIAFVSEIKDDFLRNVVNTVYENEKVMKRFLVAPASEYSSGSYLGGLATVTLESCKLAHMLCFASGEKSVDLKINSDMIFTAILLCNIGRAYMYDIDSDGKFYKNEYAVLDTDTALTRDTVRNAIKDTLNIRTEDGDRLYVPNNTDVIKELIHMIDTSKSMISMNPSITPRTRNASILSFIIGITNSMGTYDKLENSNLSHEKLVRAFDNGKVYFIPEPWHFVDDQDGDSD